MIKIEKIFQTEVVIKKYYIIYYKEIYINI